jgi:broad specificity phosphatase PhoE
LAEEAPHLHVVLVRHGATDWSESGRHTGWTDVPLNDNGLRQAAALAAPLSRWTFDAVHCSTLHRARATCELAGLAGDAEFDPDLREWNYGDYEGLTSAEIHQQRPGWNLWDDGALNGETLAQVAERADRVIERLRVAGGDVVVFAHGHLLRVLTSRWLGQPPRLGQYLHLFTAAISELGHDHGRPSLVVWNNTEHLRASG